MDVIILTDRGAQLYTALASVDGDGWLNTVQLAELTGKNQLSPHDRQLLEDMVMNGYIEGREVRSAKGIGRAAKQYRVI